MEQKGQTVLISLRELALEISRCHGEVHKSFRRALQSAIQAGELLSQAKKRVAHGEWLPWLENNTSVPARTAQQYMQLAREATSLEAKYAKFAHLGVHTALKLVSKSKEKEPDTDSDEQDPKGLTEDEGDPVEEQFEASVGPIGTPRGKPASPSTDGLKQLTAFRS